MRRFFAIAGACAVALALAKLPAFAAEATPSPPPKAGAKPSPTPTPKVTPTPSPTPKPGPPFSNMAWRSIGPAAAGGRVAAVAGSATDPKLYYVGSAGGGVWKSENGAQTWTPVFDKQKVSAIGAIAIDPNNNDVVWVGTGESNPRNDVSYGDGVYKTTDGGQTWTNVGLKPTRFISSILVDPRNSNHVIVGALGDVFNDSADRGVYVTEDGGKTWSKTLYVGPKSGVSDMAMNPQNPSIVYAGIWEFQRRPWTFQSGGPDDGIYRSSDSGRTWAKLTGNGLPEGVTGRIGLAIAPSNGNRVYAIIESAKGILWRSDDDGRSWTMVSNDTLVDQRPFYFTHLAVDPKNPDRVYAVSEFLSVSTDGGKKFTEVARAVHVDYHAIWVAPNDPKRAIVGEDGGYALTVDGGQNWFFSANLPIGQIYRVGLAVHENPYTLCVGLQDNNAWCGPSNSLDPSGILNKHWIVSAGGDGEWAIPDPADPNYLWADSENGFLQVYNRKTQDSWVAIPYVQNGIEGYDLATSKYRFNWESPIAFAPWNPHIAWLGANVLFQTADRGRHWTIVSPDLTLNLKAHQRPSGGPITHDVSGAEYSDTILDIEGGPRRGEIWVGTDDGVISLTHDGGKHWSNVSPGSVPGLGRVETIAPSTLSAGTAYAAVDRHYLGDYRPYVLVTHDYGKHWQSITNNLPRDEFARTVRPDIHNRSLVYAGTEEGIWISFDGGLRWQSFQNHLPPVSVHDIRMQAQFNDLVIATHGRSAYIMDDMTPVQQLGTATARGSMLFPIRPAYEYNLHSNDEGTYTDYSGDNPSYGVLVNFYQSSAQRYAPTLTILDSKGRAVRTVKGTHKVNGKDVPYVPNNVGINHYVWDFQTDGPIKWTGAAKPRYQGPNEGAFVVPGRYSARIALNGHTYVQRFTVRPDPLTIFTLADMQFGYNFARKYYQMFGNIDVMLNNLDTVKKALDAATDDAKKKNNTALSSKIDATLTARKAIFDILTADYHNDEDGIQRPGKLREDVQGLTFIGFPVTPPAMIFGKRLDAAFADAAGKYNGFVTGPLAQMNAALKAASMKPVPSVNLMHVR